MSIVGVLECLLAISLFLWYRVDISPALQNCAPDLTSGGDGYSNGLFQQPITYECMSGFVDPPSLRTSIHHFGGVSDCSTLGGVLGTFHWTLLALYAVGIALAVLAGVLAIKRLHASGACCGKSGAYAVTPEPTTPTLSGISHFQAVSSPTHAARIYALSTAPSSGSTLPGFSVTQR